MGFDSGSMIARRVPGWELVLLFGEADQLIRALDSARLTSDLESVPAASGRVIDSLEGALEFILERLPEVRVLVAAVERAFSPALITRAAGGTGESGDEEALRHLAVLWAGCWQVLLSWGAELRAARVPAPVRPLYDQLASFTERPANQIRDFIVDGFGRACETAASIDAGADPPDSFRLSLWIEVDPALVDSTLALIEALVAEDVGEAQHLEAVSAPPSPERTARAELQPPTGSDPFLGFVGQRLAKQRLEGYVLAAVEMSRPVGHILLAGPPGSGRTSLAALVAQLVGDPFRSFTMPVQTALLSSFLRHPEWQGGVVLLENLHRASRGEQRDLSILLEDGYLLRPNGRRVEAGWLTLIGETSEPASLSPALYNGFPIKVQLEPYEPHEMSQIVHAMAEREMLQLTDQLAKVIVAGARGLPKRALSLVLAAKQHLISGRPLSVERLLQLCQLESQDSALPDAWSRERRSRVQIPDDVKMFVWRRDEGRCTRCGSKELLEFDHIIPVALGGSNTARNIQLLCEACNRAKGANLA